MKIYRKHTKKLILELESNSLSRADLSGADLYRADLSGADLSRAYLSGADLSRADLQRIREDLYTILATVPLTEVIQLQTILQSGRIDGSVYEGACACLVGTLAKIKSCDYHTFSPNSDRPIERWFLALRPGMTPENTQIARITDQWITDYLTAHA